jgi:hypothetical protein
MLFLQKPPRRCEETRPSSSGEATGKARGPRWSRRLESLLYDRLVDSRARGSRARGLLVLARIVVASSSLLSDLPDALPTSATTSSSTRPSRLRRRRHLRRVAQMGRRRRRSNRPGPAAALTRTLLLVNRCNVGCWAIQQLWS